MLNILVFGFICLVLCWILTICFPPISFPNNIPTIPFYSVFIPQYYNIDQVQFYNLYVREKLEKYGAVKFYFGSRWNILVSRPEFLNNIFKNEDTFAKSGNQQKIPYSVLAAYTGDNVISAHGVNWQKYRKPIKDGLQHFDIGILLKNAMKFCELIKEDMRPFKYHCNFKIIPYIQRLTLDNICRVGLGFEFGAIDEDNNSLHRQLIQIKKQIFDPFYLNFPMFDRLPIPSRLLAFQNVENFRSSLVDKVQKQLIKTYKFEQANTSGSALVRAYNNGELTNKQLTDNIVILLVAGHENPQLFISNLIYLLGKYHDTWQVDIRNEILNNEESNLSELPLLNSFLYECLRYYPPLSVIINRKTTKRCMLGPGIVVPKDTYVGYHNYSTCHDSNFWGHTADIFDPTRWGKDIETINKAWKTTKNNCILNTFHGGKRACLGEKLVFVSTRIIIAEFLSSFEWKLSPLWVEQMTHAGPLCPKDLALDIRVRDTSMQIQKLNKYL